MPLAVLRLYVPEVRDAAGGAETGAAHHHNVLGFVVQDLMRHVFERRAEE